MEKMGMASAVKKFFEMGATRPIKNVEEFIPFWKACSMEERLELAESAAKQLGVELEFTPIVAKA